MILILLLLVFAGGCVAQPNLATPVTILPNAAHTVGGKLIILNPTAAHDIFQVSDNGSGKGQMVVADGTGAGGWDSAGAKVLCVADSFSGMGPGVCEAFSFFAQTGTIQVTMGTQTASGVGISMFDTSVHDTVWMTPGQFIGFNSSTLESWFLQGSSSGVFALTNGTGSGGFLGNGETILMTGSNGTIKSQNGNTSTIVGDSTAIGVLVTNTASTNNVGISGASVTELRNGVAGHTVWSTFDNGAGGGLALSDGSGSGGFDGNGAHILGNGATGLLQASSLQLTTPLATTYGGVPQSILTGFTATLTSAGASVTISSQNCAYQQIGQFVFMRLDITFSYTGSATASFALGGASFITPTSVNFAFAEQDNQPSISPVIFTYAPGLGGFFVAAEGGNFPTSSSIHIVADGFYSVS